MIRNALIGALMYVGWLMLMRGAQTYNKDIILMGLLVLSVMLGIVIGGSHRVTVFMRNHSKAIWRAGIVRHIFRRLS